MAVVPFTATYATAGTFTWTCPPGVTSVAVACTGGGGGGGSVSATSGSNGGGGGGGEAAVEPSVTVTPNLGYTVTVGAGGAGGTAGSNGSNGGNTSFAGDTVTPLAHGGQGGNSATTGAGQGGQGGTGSVDNVSADGGAGADGTVSSNGGGGGGAAGASATGGFPGNAGSGSTAGGASGGTWPGGAGGAGSTSGAGPGSGGSGPGGGGGGALSTGTNRQGGAGADGQVVVTWSMTDPVTLTADTVGGSWQFTAPAGATAVQAQAWGAGAGGFNVASGGAGAFGGFSAFNTAYGGSNRQQAAATADGYLSRPMALAAQWTYQVVESSWPITTGSFGLKDLAAMGVRVGLSFKPSRQAVVTGGSALAAEQASLAAACAVVNSIAGLQWYACIFNEPNGYGRFGAFGDGTQKDGPTPYGPPGSVTAAQAAANYIAYHNAYAPTINAAGIQVAYKPALFSNNAAIAYFPGAGSATGGCDLITFDWYAQDLIKNSIDAFGTDPTANIEAIADANSLPLGIGEWGANGGSNVPTVSDYQNVWIPHFIAGWSNRMNAGKPVWDVIYFGGNGTGGPNVITGPSDYKVPGCQQVYDLFASSTQSGGAGGGGGEYAAQAATPLAITSGHQYAIVIGAGGAGKQAGGNTTVAGDSVTVTAHGGSVATSTSAGGAGGTGSSNTAHHDGGAGGAGGGANGGGGGGGASGGTGAAGNAGAAGGANFGGAGGTAVTGGGPGGKAGGPNGAGQAPVSGPGGGGGARGASGAGNGAGFDGQITLSSFTTTPTTSGSFALAGLGLAGTGQVGTSSFALAGLGLRGTANVSGFALVQNGTTVTGSGGTITLTLASTGVGSLLVAVIAFANQSGSTGSPSGWQLAKAQNSGGTSGRIEIWHYPNAPAGITSAAWTYTSGDTRGHAAEYDTPSGFIQAVDQSGSASSAVAATSLPVSTSSSSAAGDLGIAAFEAAYSPAQTGSWTDPAGWTKNRAQFSGETNAWGSWYKTGLSSGTQSVTGTVPTSTSQTGWSAALVVFKATGSNTMTGRVALAGPGFSATGTSTVPPGTVACNGGIGLAGPGFQSPSLAVTFPAQQLPVLVEILINGAWTDITSDVYQRDGITISGRGRPNEASTAQPAQVTMTLNNASGNYSPQNAGGVYYPYLVRNTQLRISVTGAVTASGAWYGTPDNPGYRFWGEVPAWPPQWTLDGSDVYITLTAVGVLQRMQQSKYSASPLARYYTNIINASLSSGLGASTSASNSLVPAGYWPCEDAANVANPALSSASFASGVPGGSPMTWTGTPGLAADTSIPGSSAFAQLNSSVWTGTPGSFSDGGITYATAGTYTWTCPGDVTSVTAECWGGGGGGGGIDAFGQGGAGGEYAKQVVTVTPGSQYTVIVGAGGAGSRGGGPGVNGTTGGNGGKSTFSADTVTVTAHGGQGARTTQGNAANGGTGSSNATHHDGGNGAADPANGQFGGQGGGGSGGTTQAGNNGHQNSNSDNSGGAGGAAVGGGGPGGAGGHGFNGGSTQATPGLMPSPGPGGGGGGGGFNNFTSYRRAGGGGQAGQVKLTYGASTRPPANVIRAVLHVPSGGATDQSQPLQAVTNGTVAFLNLTYHTGGGLELIGRNSGLTQLFDSGIVAFGADNTPMLVTCELRQSDATHIFWKLAALKPGGTAVVKQATGTISGTLGSVTSVTVNNAAGHTDTTATGVGHITVQYAVDPILNLSQPLNAYIGEAAGVRFTRLCGEQNVPVALTSTAGVTGTAPGIVVNDPDTPKMGPQPAGLLSDLLQDCENADLGQMYELRNAFGLGYITRTALQNQAPAAIIDYTQGQLAAGLTPTDDDQLIRNDILATRAAGGTSYETVLTTGALSVQDPPSGVGLYQYQVTPNLYQDSQLAAFATWLLTLGTLDEFRYPVITLNLVRLAISNGPFAAAAGLDIGDFLQIINTPSWLPPGPVNQLCYGFTETLNAFEWTIAVNAVPEDPYTAGSSAPLPTW